MKTVKKTWMTGVLATAIKSASRAVRPALLCLPLVLSGCFGLNRGAPVPQHYVLGAGGQAEPAALAGSATDSTVIGLRPPRLAEYLASPFIVVRQGTHRIGFSEFDRWGEDLARGINRTLSAHIASRSPTLSVETAPWPASARPDYLVQLHFLRFEGVAPDDPLDPVGATHLLASWEVLRSTDGAVLLSRTTEVRADGWTVGDFDGLVSQLDAGLGELADDIVRGLEQVRASQGDESSAPGTSDPP